MKKILALLMAFMLCLPLLVSCQKDGEGEGETSKEVGTPISIIANGASGYTIVYAAGSSELAGPSYKIARSLQSTIKEATGVELPVVSEQIGTYDKEILIGPVERASAYTSPVSAETYQLGYSVYLWENKIVVNGGSETGLRMGINALIKELLGLDMMTTPKVEGIEGKTEFSVLSTFAASETFAFEDFPFLNASLSEFAVCFDSSNYMERRAAIILQQEIKDSCQVVLERADKSWPQDKGSFYFSTDNTVADGAFRIKTEGKRITLSAKDYYGFTSAVRAVMKLKEDLGFFPFRDTEESTGVHLDYLGRYEETAKYAFNNLSDYRLMFYNVLWDNNNLNERATLQIDAIKAYDPDVIGLQEFRENRRSKMVPALLEMGYAETMNYKDGNMISAAYGEGTKDTLYSTVPIFYKTETTRCIDTGFWRYSSQHSAAESASKTLCWALLETVETNERYLVVNTHMCTQADSIKREQAVEAVRIINQLLEEHNVPVFLGGDYNGRYTNSNYQYFSISAGFTDVEKSNLPTEYTSKMKTFHQDYPAYRESLGLMWPADNDNTGKSPELSVDHIMVKNHSYVDISVYGVVVDDYTMSGGDHYPIFVDFSIR